MAVSAALGGGVYAFDAGAAAGTPNRHGLAIGETSSEQVKLEIGGVEPNGTDAAWEVRGRDPVSGLPREVEVTAEEGELRFHVEEKETVH